MRDVVGGEKLQVKEKGLEGYGLNIGDFVEFLGKYDGQGDTYIVKVHKGLKKQDPFLRDRKSVGVTVNTTRKVIAVDHDTCLIASVSYFLSTGHLYFKKIKLTIKIPKTNENI